MTATEPTAEPVPPDASKISPANLSAMLRSRRLRENVTSHRMAKVWPRRA